MEFTATLTFKSLHGYKEGTSEKGAWKKQDAVFETRENYAKLMAMTAFNGWADSLAKCKPGEVYDVTFEIASREWNGKFYTDLSIRSLAAHPTVSADQQQQQAQPAPALPLDQQPGIEELDDLPF